MKVYAWKVWSVLEDGYISRDYKGTLEAIDSRNGVPLHETVEEVAEELLDSDGFVKN